MAWAAVFAGVKLYTTSMYKCRSLLFGPSMHCQSAGTLPAICAAVTRPLLIPQTRILSFVNLSTWGRLDLFLVFDSIRPTNGKLGTCTDSIATNRIRVPHAKYYFLWIIYRALTFHRVTATPHPSPTPRCLVQPNALRCNEQREQAHGGRLLSRQRRQGASAEAVLVLQAWKAFVLAFFSLFFLAAVYDTHDRNVARTPTCETLARY